VVRLPHAAAAPRPSFHRLLRLCSDNRCRRTGGTVQMSPCDWNERPHMVFISLEAFLHSHVSFAVIGCGWLQALRVGGAPLITAKRGGQAHPPQTSPLNIFMCQVGLHHLLIALTNSSRKDFVREFISLAPNLSF